jgi:hypothetical protein
MHLHLNTSPRASASVLPCSRVMMAAISSWWLRMRAWYLVVSSIIIHMRANEQGGCMLKFMYG